MDFNEYVLTSLIKQRHAEMVAAARRDALRRAHTPRSRALRVTLGTVLIRAGARLLRDQYAATSLNEPRALAR